MEWRPCSRKSSGRGNAPDAGAGKQKQKSTANIIQVHAIDVEHKREKEPLAAHATWTRPEGITATMLYLCSDAAGTINGQRLLLAGH